MKTEMATLKKTDEAISREIWDADYIFCIDGGGSKTSLQVISSCGKAVDIEHRVTTTQSLLGGSTNINVVGLPETLTTLETLLTGIKVGPDKLTLEKIPHKSIMCGLAGLSSNMDKIDLVEEVLTAHGFEKSQIALNSDVDIAKGLIDKNGAVLIAGAGSICLSKRDNEEKRIGGYGWALDDGGSGFYFGKRALVKAWSCMDQKKEPFVLTEKLCNLFGVTSISDVVREFYGGTIKSCDVAKAAPLVFKEAFKQSDEECRLIVEDGAKELADLIKIAVQGSDHSGFPIYLIGGIFKDENVNDFIEMIERRVSYDPGLEFINIAHENIAAQVIQKMKAHRD